MREGNQLMTDTYTANDWSLFRHMAVAPGAPTRDEVAADLNAALDDSIRTGDIAYIEHELKHHRAHGANDSEGRNFAFRKYHEGRGVSYAGTPVTVDAVGRSYHSFNRHGELITMSVPGR